MTSSLAASVVPADQSIDGLAWNVVGHVYRPKSLSEASFAWHADFPADTFVPPHIHPTQDEFIYVLTGELEVNLDGQDLKAGPGAVINMPRGQPHGLFNRSGKMATCLFWVAPARKLFELFQRLDNLTDIDEIVRISAEHEVEFLPPPAG